MSEPTQDEIVAAAAVILKQAARWRRAAIGNHGEFLRRDRALLDLEVLVREITGIESGVLPR